MDKAFFDYENFKTDKIRSVDAKFEAQKIAFAPLSFQAVNTLLELGIMKIIEDSGDIGISLDEHDWAEANLNGTLYIFDPDVEDDISGGGTEYRFCKTYDELAKEYKR